MAVPDPAPAPKKMGFGGFGFKTKAAAPKKAAVQEKKEEVVKQTLTDISEGELKLLDPVETGPVVIPCKRPLVLQGKKRPNQAPTSDPSSKAPKLGEADQAALDEIKAEAKGETSAAQREAEAAVPILMQNSGLWEKRKALKAEGKQGRHADRALYEEELKILPDTDKEQFERVSVDNFGIAMLRGMGFDPNGKHVKPIETKRRDAGLGLGAMPRISGMLLPDEKAKLEKEKVEKLRLQEERRKKQAAEESTGWLLRGLLVKITGSREEHKVVVNQVAVVQEAAADKLTGAISVRDPAGKKHKFQGVPAAELTPSVSRASKAVKIVRGPAAGTVAKLKQRDSLKNRAVIVVDGADQVVRLTDICDFMEGT